MKKTSPKISIVTPNYNGGKYLEQTILSVLSQNYPNIEYIIIDGGSTDNSLNIIKKYESKISYWVSEPDQGLYDAVQKGFEKSTGEIMAWINSDDMYHCNAFFIVQEIFETFDNVEWIVGLQTHFDEKGRIISFDPLRSWSKYDFYIGDYQWIQQESVFWKRSIWERSGSFINGDLKYAADFELWSRFFQVGELYSVSIALAGFRLRSTAQISLDHIEEYHKEANSVIDKMNLSREEKKVIRNYNIYRKVDAFLKFVLFFKFRLSVHYKKRAFVCPKIIVLDRKSQTFMWR